MSGGLSKAEAAFPPKYPCQFLNQMLLGSLRRMLRHKRRDEPVILVRVLPWQHG